MKNRKQKIITFITISLLLIITIILKIAFYTPPLLDRGKRNIAEKTVDFLHFSWHFTKASVYKDILKNESSAGKASQKATWYDKNYLAKTFGLNQEDSVMILKVYGENLITWNKWEHAAKAFTKAADSSPNDPLCYYYLGLCQINLKKFDDASGSFEKAVAIKPDFADAYYQLGRIAENKKEWDKAKALFESALNLLPNHLDSLKSLQRIAENIH